MCEATRGENRNTTLHVSDWSAISGEGGAAAVVVVVAVVVVAVVVVAAVAVVD